MIHVTASALDPDLGDHVCLPFSGDRERRAATRLFTLNGLRRRAKVLIVTHTDSPEGTRTWLAPSVPGFGEAESAGRIEIEGSAVICLAGGRPDPGRALDGLRAAGERAAAQGHNGLYALVDASWGMHDPAAQMAFESAVNALFGRHPLAAVCQYDRALFPREALDRVAAVHPISPEQALLRYAVTTSPPGLRLKGDIDLTNRQALASILEPLRERPEDVLIDASEVGFVDAGSAQLIVAMALARRPGRTVLVCRSPLLRLLRLLRADDALGVRPVDDV